VRGGQDAEEVSRHHCVIEVDPPQVRVRDLGSLNGTFVNGVLIGRRPVHLSPEESDPASLPAFPVRDGDEIRVGDTVLRVRIPLPVAAGG
jgi:pSer/pThr/pTyr-binding forkhead associated (FHA) protein